MNKLLKQRINDKVSALMEIVPTTRKCLKAMIKRGYKAGLTIDYGADVGYEGYWIVGNNNGVLIDKVREWRELEKIVEIIEAYKAK
ncbi:MAG: hypothetical protein KZQ74_01415 [gamma proteobacterium symbiont of Bathyaustriella thionipta]|nr:hypothetical protein [gamma proteobacterium symbiont of Bathyaustriella thionipta]MCU7951773.1 hypothetical protein [gamma proteobacterium symbiont of Bathyaustriella thionipta]MCU7958374.1 hypothetical protein [gamma proteobacterium symbiont of Bathyaustriella thionipta]MCU7965864.1 hypothetical protein [gamma proteobacterium symbiont of Bathyaustriella thionipta]